MKNIAEMLRHTVERTPDRLALSFKGGHLTWYEIYARAVLLCNQLKKAGLGRGNKVAIYADHSPAQVIALFGVAMADAIFTIIHPLLKENQIKHQANDANIRAIITTEKKRNVINKLFEHRQIYLETISVDGLLIGMDPTQIPHTECNRPITQSIPTDVACIIYTSGSTGRPKGVVVPQKTLLDGARIVSGYLNITRDDALLSILPFNFDYGLNQLMTVAYTGARIVLRRFTLPQDLIKVLVEEKITGMAGVPSMWPHILNPKLFNASNKPDFEYLRYITTAGGVHTQDLLKKLTAFFPKTEIIIMYGLTESFRSTYLPFSQLFKRPGSIGKAVPEVEILAVNNKGEYCKPGEKGELIHRGAFVTYGYLNDPDLTKQKFIHLKTGGPGCLPEMAVRSGDIVSLDEDGFIYFHGREDMQIKCSGYRISPGEVEEAVVLIPDVSHTAVFGLPDSELGQSVNLAYSTYSRSPIDRIQIFKHLNRVLPSYAVPRHIHFYPNLPLTENGKIDYSVLRRDVSGGTEKDEHTLPSASL